MTLLVGNRVEERTSIGHSPRWPSILQPPTNSIIVCLIGGWTVVDNLKRRRTVILLAWEKEQKKHGGWSRI
jgi:hypothetical protein